MGKLFIQIAIMAVALISFSQAFDDGCTDEQRKSFESFKVKFEKKYVNADAEDQARKCFCKAENKIQEHNKGDSSFEIGHTPDSDGCRKVGASFKTGYQHSEVKNGTKIPETNKKVSAAPGGVTINGGIDFSTKTSPVKSNFKFNFLLN